MHWTTHISLIPAALWIGFLLLPWHPWGTREALESTGPDPNDDLDDVTALVPARNEAQNIEASLTALMAQGRSLSVILIDDESTDATVDAARKLSLPRLQVLPGAPRPQGWSGKLWALHQGLEYVRTPFTLLIDADIELRPGLLATLRHRMRSNGLQLVSLMAALRMSGFWERLLMPAFVYFFKAVYPFRLSNSRFTGVAAAAGGCILIETRVLHQVGAFESLRGELIDDCALARRVKSLGYRTWIGLTRSAISLRPYGRLASIWNMVARTAYTQLHHSGLLLLLCTCAMIGLFCFPVVFLLVGVPSAKLISAAALGAMFFSYFPTLAYYNMPKVWAAALPFVGLLYLAMTWTSALQAWRGKGALWKGRSY